jgi:protein TonB
VREPEIKPAAAGFSIFGSGTASAPAPAREAPEAKPSEAADDAILDDSTGTTAEPAAVVGSTPSFTFGGARTESESSGGKKILIGVAASIIVAVGIYTGWVHFQGTSEQPASSEAPPTSAPAAISQPVKPSDVPASLPKAPARSTQESQPSKAPSPEKLQEEIDAAAASNKSSGISSEKAAKADANEITEPAPLVVKGGKAPAAKTKAADAPAPSLIGMATPGATVPPPNLVTSTEPAFKPTLQTLNISQGVSQGLLIKKVPPSYPPNALRMHIEGAVELTATISKTGLISQIKVLSGDPQLTKAAADAVKQWKYKPYLLNGEPVEIQTQITINFKLPH